MLRPAKQAGEVLGCEVCNSAAANGSSTVANLLAAALLQISDPRTEQFLPGSAG